MRLLIRRFVTVTVSATILLLLCGGLPLIAQEPTASKAKTGKRAYDPSRRVPAYFAKIGLTNEQKESIYAIQAKQMPKIEALEKQIDELRAQMLRDCEATLTSTQKKLLEQQRAGAAAARSKKSMPVAKPKS